MSRGQGAGSKGSLPPAPFVAWAQRLSMEFGTWIDAERSMVIDNGTFQRAVSRARAQSAVRIEMVDGFFTAAGEPHQLALLYPQDVESMEDRWCPTCVELVTAGDDELCPWCDTTVDEPRPERARADRADERRRRAKELRAAGLSYSAIACRLGVALSTAHGYVNTGS